MGHLYQRGTTWWIQGEEIVSSKKKQRRGPTNGTINREVALLLKLLRLGVEHNKVSRMPIVHKPEENPARQGSWSPPRSRRCGRTCRSTFSSR